MTGFAPMLRDKSGATAMMFSLLIIPLLASVGVFLDYTSAATARTHVQSAIDTVALRLAQNGATWDQARMQTEGNTLLRALLVRLVGLAVLLEQLPDAAVRLAAVLAVGVGLDEDTALVPSEHCEDGASVRGVHDGVHF